MPRGSLVTMDDRFAALFELPLAEFTAARNALAATVKKEGDAARSKEIKALARPSLSAWVVNKLFRSSGDAFNDLLDAGEKLRGAASSSAGADELRAAQKRQAECVAVLRATGERWLKESGQAATPSTMDRVARSLQAISSRGSFAPYQAGCLCADVEPPSFDELAAVVGELPTATRAPAIQPTAAVPDPAPSSVRLREAPQRSVEANSKKAAKLQAAQTVLEEARRKLDAISREAAALMETLGTLKEATRAARAKLEVAVTTERLAVAAESDASTRAAALLVSRECQVRACAGARGARGHPNRRLTWQSSRVVTRGETRSDRRP